MKAAEFQVVKLANRAAHSQFSYYHQVMSNSLGASQLKPQAKVKAVDRKPTAPVQANAK